MADTEKLDLSLSSLDRLFLNEKIIDESGPREIPLALIDDFPNNPYKVRDDEDMAILTDSIRERGLITPALVRQKSDGRYELVSGHRRKFACLKLGFVTIKCEVVDLNDDEAAVTLVDSNFQRSKILLSEKAFAYLMKYEAIKKRSGERTDRTCDPVGHRFAGVKTAQILADFSSDCKTQIMRYIRLTKLIPELLQIADEEKIKFRAAVELSFIGKEGQKEIFSNIEKTGRYPKYEEAKKLRKEYVDLEENEAEIAIPPYTVEHDHVTDESLVDYSIAESMPILNTKPVPSTKSETNRIKELKPDPIQTKPALYVYENEQKAYPNDETVTESKDGPSTVSDEISEKVVEREIVITSETVRHYFNDFGSIENMEAFIRRSLDDNHERIKRQREQENNSIPTETED